MKIWDSVYTYHRFDQFPIWKIKSNLNRISRTQICPTISLTPFRVTTDHLTTIPSKFCYENLPRRNCWICFRSMRRRRAWRVWRQSERRVCFLWRHATIGTMTRRIHWPASPSGKPAKQKIEVVTRPDSRSVQCGSVLVEAGNDFVAFRIMVVYMLPVSLVLRSTT